MVTVAFSDLLLLIVPAALIIGGFVYERGKGLVILGGLGLILAGVGVFSGIPMLLFAVVGVLCVFVGVQALWEGGVK